MLARSVPDFPYKREFIDPEELWNNAVTLDLMPLYVLPEHDKWRSIPAKFNWEFTSPLTGETKRFGFIQSDESYHKVNILVDYFSEPARMLACRREELSPMEFYQLNYPKVQALAKQLEVKNPKLPFRYHLREAIYQLSKECSSFNIALTKAILKMFKSKNVLDPSAGWGDRVLGAAAAGVETYHGIDPNPNLRNFYDDILEFIRKHVGEKNYGIITEDFLETNVQTGYDTVFTSPPFFDYEIYVSDPKQSIQNRSNLNDWINGFLYPYLFKAWQALIPGGFLILYISDVKGGQYTEKMHDYVTYKLGGRFLGILTVAKPDLQFGWPIWVWQKV